MPEVIRLPLETANGRPLMHKFYRHHDGAEGLVVLLPGGNYGVDGPMLYYASEILQAAGWDSFAVTYGFQTAMEELSLEIISGLVDECRNAVRHVLSERAYPRIGLIGKSIGASVAAHICQVEPSLQEARLVVLNPPLGHPFFDSTFVETSQPALIATGTADRFYDADALERLHDTRAFQQIVIDGADHSMDVVGDLEASLEAMKWIVGTVVDFLVCD